MKNNEQELNNTDFLQNKIDNLNDSTEEKITITEEELKCIPTKLHLPEEWQKANLESKLRLFQRLQHLLQTTSDCVKEVEADILKIVDKPEVDEKGILQTTAIIDKERGDIAPSIFQWSQRVTKGFNIEDARNQGINTDALYETKLMTNEEIKKELKAQYISPNIVDNLFNIPIASKPKIALKKLK